MFIESREKYEVEKATTEVAVGFPMCNVIVSSLTSRGVLNDKESSSDLVVMVDVAG